MGIQSLERRLERMVDGVFTSRSRPSIKPIELGRRLLREMDDQRSVDVKGRRVVPNEFVIRLNPTDRNSFGDIEPALVEELIEAAREYARDEGYYFMGPVNVALAADDHVKPGRISIDASLRQGVTGAVTASIVTPRGDRIPVRDKPVTIGRASECGISISDTNVSRRHAEVRPARKGWIVVDLQSTNGTLINGARITADVSLNDGDVITVGETNLRFEAS